MVETRGTVYISTAAADEGPEMSRFLTDLGSAIGAVSDRRAVPPVSIFHANTELVTGENWRERLRFELERCTVLVALMSAAFFASHWTGREWTAASRRNVRIIPVWWRDAPDHAPEIARNLVWFQPGNFAALAADGPEAYDEAVVRLAETIIGASENARPSAVQLGEIEQLPVAWQAGDVRTAEAESPSEESEPDAAPSENPDDLPSREVAPKGGSAGGFSRNSAPDLSEDPGRGSRPDASSGLFSRFSADVNDGPDVLELDDDIDALGLLISSTALEPPLAVGVTGEWGAGKTFFLNKLHTQVERLSAHARETGRPQYELGVFRRIVQVRFNAWYYPQDNLLASLVDAILGELPSKQPGQAAGYRTKEMRELSDLRQTLAEKDAETLDDLDRQAQQIRNEIEGLRKDDKAGAAELRGLSLTDLAFLVDLDETVKAEVKDAVRAVGLEQQVGKTVQDAADTVADAKALLHRANAILTPLRRSGKAGALWAALLMVAVLVGPAVAWLLHVVSAPAVTQLIGAVAGFAATGIGLVRSGSTWVSTALGRVEGANQRLRAKLVDEHRTASDLATKEKELAGLEARRAALAEKHQRVQQLEKRVDELTPGQVLAQFVEDRADAADYRGYLGLMALVREDLSSLSRLAGANNSRLLQPADSVAQDADQEDMDLRDDGVNRLVLYIDDLDRCPPDRVIAVLEAVHLLLAFPLFVVVIAIDERWLEQSLLKHYESTLSIRTTDNRATPRDYLEKIIQVTLRLSPLGPAARWNLVEHLTRPVRAAILTDNPGRPVGAPTELPEDTTGDDLRSGDFDRPHNESQSITDPEPGRAFTPTTTPDEFVTRPTMLDLDAAEQAFARELRFLLGTSPRSVKRFVNVYRLIKVVRALHSSADTGFEKAMFLAAVGTGIPDVGKELFQRISRSDARPLLDVIRPVPSGDPTDWQLLVDWVKDHDNFARMPAAELAPVARHVSRYCLFT